MTDVEQPLCAVTIDSPVARRLDPRLDSEDQTQWCHRPAYEAVAERGMSGTWCCPPHVKAYREGWPESTITATYKPPVVPQEEVEEAIASIRSVIPRIPAPAIS